MLSHAGEKKRNGNVAFEIILTTSSMLFQNSKNSIDIKADNRKYYLRIFSEMFTLKISGKI